MSDGERVKLISQLLPLSEPLSVFGTGDLRLGASIIGDDGHSRHVEIELPPGAVSEFWIEREIPK